MLSIARRTTAGAAFLLIMPAFVWISGWAWEPDQRVGYLKILYWISKTVTKPWGIVTQGLLCTWFLRCLLFRLRSAVMMLAILGTVILAEQSIKLWLKNTFQEPRPFVSWLEKTHHVPVNTFYKLKRKDRGYLLKSALALEQNVPDFLCKQWGKETGFALPSGHTMFASSWAILGVGLLWPRRHIITIFVLLIWAISVMGGRLLLGMHCPRDLVVATLISWFLVTLATWLTQRVCGSLTPP